MKRLYIVIFSLFSIFAPFGCEYTVWDLRMGGVELFHIIDKNNNNKLRTFINRVYDDNWFRGGPIVITNPFD